MSKIEIAPLPSGHGTAAALNQRLQLIEDALNNDVLWRDTPPAEPNNMENDLDMDSNRILNLPDAELDHEPIPFGQAEEMIEQEVHDQLTEQLLLVGTGNVVGPLSSIDNQIAIFDGVTGKLLKTGNPISPTPSAGDNSERVATTEFVRRDAITTVATIADASALIGLVAGQLLEVREYSAGTGVGGGTIEVISGSTTPNNVSTFSSATAGCYLSRVYNGAYTIEMAGGLDDGVVDNKVPHERVRGLGMPVLMLSDGTYYFSAPPTIPANATTILNGLATLSGVTTGQLNAQVISHGQVCGVPFAQAIRDSRIGIVCGTIRAHQPQSVTSITRSGATATVTHTAHGYSSGMPVVIAGANETEYNTAGSSPTTITVIDPDTYTYTVSGTPASPATGTITSRNPSWWFYINDADHTPLGMTTSGIYNPITGTSSLLTLGMDNTYGKVLSVVVCPDETLASAQGMSIGPSVSLNGIALRASCDRTFAYEIFYNSGTGLWSFSSSSGQDLLESFTYSSGNLVINHKYCPKVNLQLTPYSRNGTVTPYIPVIKALTNTSFTVNFLDYGSGGLVITTADNRMSMYASKNFNNLVPFDGSSGSWSLPFYLGNIWFLGIMQY
jgi:hypothetical protein